MNILFTIVCLFIFSSQGCSSPVRQNDPVTVVMFGATGDLAARKLFPALHHLSIDGEITDNVSIVSVGRRELTSEEFQNSVYSSLQKFSSIKPNESNWDAFKQSITYQKTDFSEADDYLALKDHLKNHSKNRLFYLATDSSYFSVIIENLYKSGLISPNDGSRVVIEKPFGRDLNSSIELQSFISQFLDETQIFRMDHYLGKEGVHKLLKFRFEDGAFDSLLNEKYVSSIQVAISETIGIGTRANFYENTGHLRDVIQNHAMQVLALGLMEPPASLAAEDILKEKARVLYAVRPFPANQIDQYVIRGQYAAGLIQDKPVVGYLEEDRVPQSSQIETFVQAELYIDNPRWQGVPIFISSGKRLPEQSTEIVFNLKENKDGIEKIRIAIQPDPQIYITKNARVEVYPIDPSPSFSREAYENLILAAIKGDRSHFVTIDEVLATWSLLTPVLESWSNTEGKPVLLYEAGKWGPKEAEDQTNKYNINWRM